MVLRKFRFLQDQNLEEDLRVSKVLEHQKLRYVEGLKLLHESKRQVEVSFYSPIVAIPEAHQTVN